MGKKEMQSAKGGEERRGPCMNCHFCLNISKKTQKSTDNFIVIFLILTLTEQVNFIFLSFASENLNI